MPLDIFFCVRGIKSPSVIAYVYIKYIGSAVCIYKELDEVVETRTVKTSKFGDSSPHWTWVVQ